MILMLEYQLGDYLQTIYQVDNNSVQKVGSVPATQLADSLANLYKEMNSEELILRGVQSYCEQIAAEARTLGNVRYGLNNMNIKIME